MPVSDDFLQHVLKKLRPLGMIFARKMFGGFGLYAGEQFFGILHDDKLYFKVSAANIADYQKAKMKPFKPFNDKPLTLKYFEVPASVQRNAVLLRKWAKKSIDGAEVKSLAPEAASTKLKTRGKWYE